MKSLAIAGFLIGLIFFWTLYAYEPSSRASLQAESIATGFVLYRNAVNLHAVEHKTQGSIPTTALNLPGGLASLAWKNNSVWEDGELLCYVYGAASPETTAEVLRLLRHSPAVGWNNKGWLVRSGPTHALPGFIGDRDLVSVIIIDSY